MPNGLCRMLPPAVFRSNAFPARLLPIQVVSHRSGSDPMTRMLTSASSWGAEAVVLTGLGFPVPEVLDAAWGRHRSLS